MHLFSHLVMKRIMKVTERSGVQIHQVVHNSLRVLGSSLLDVVIFLVHGLAFDYQFRKAMPQIPCVEIVLYLQYVLKVVIEHIKYTLHCFP